MCLHFLYTFTDFLGCCSFGLAISSLVPYLFRIDQYPYLFEVAECEFTTMLFLIDSVV